MASSGTGVCGTIVFAASATNSTPPTTEVAIPTASRTPESVLWARSRTRVSTGRNNPAPAAAEQTRKAAVESSRISLYPPFTASQIIKARNQERRSPEDPALLYQRKRTRAREAFSEDKKLTAES